MVKISQELLYGARVGEPVDSFLILLKNVPEKELQNALNTDDKRLAFWINVYNATTQLALHDKPERYKNRNAFFSKKLITIAGEKLSLDNIEHGILRRNKIKWSYGYFNKIFPGSFEKKFRVDKLDSRIHFALNCGAKSCPPIAYYEAEKIDEQLNVATLGHLKAETNYDQKKDSIALPAFMGWFRADFGGKKGMRKLLKKLEIIPEESKASISFQQYNWKLYLDNYVE